MKMNLLVDSDEYWMCLREDILSAQQRVFLQTLSLEGDQIGQSLSSILLELHSVEKKIIVDSFGKWVINDKWVLSPLSALDTGLHFERKSTLQMIENLKTNGIDVKFINPVGFLFSKFATRNHKKLALIDNRIAYIGGMNYTEHNFSWHDLMLRIEDRDVTELLTDDFLATWEGKNLCLSERFDGIEIHTLDGYSNEVIFDSILRLIEQAKERVFIESPYLSFPFCASLQRARKRGVAVTVISPHLNNWEMVKEYIIEESVKADFELRFYSKGMVHLKAILIDDKYLVIGSSNFDYLSYRLHQEIVAIVTEPSVIAEFIQKVVRNDLKCSWAFTGSVNPLRLHVVNCALELLTKSVVLAGIHFRPTA